MARHAEIWRMTLGKFQIKNQYNVHPLEVYNTPEVLLITGTITEPESKEGRKVRVEFKPTRNGIANAHQLIDELQEWIRSNG